MRKIPTIYLRDEADPKYVTRKRHPGCAWVFAGEGVATRKYDGTCVSYDGQQWWARREVKPGKLQPPGYLIVELDSVTGKTVGWEPMTSSPFAKFHDEALKRVVDTYPGPVLGATYELCGPKINGNPEKLVEHMLIRHGYMSATDSRVANQIPMGFDDLGEWLHGHEAWEGVVWHHPDGRRAKAKRRDFRPPKTVAAPSLLPRGSEAVAQQMPAVEFRDVSAVGADGPNTVPPAAPGWLGTASPGAVPLGGVT
jgi:hypothetical protein